MQRRKENLLTITRKENNHKSSLMGNILMFRPSFTEHTPVSHTDLHWFTTQSNMRYIWLNWYILQEEWTVLTRPPRRAKHPRSELTRFNGEQPASFHQKCEHAWLPSVFRYRSSFSLLHASPHTIAGYYEHLHETQYHTVGHYSLLVTDLFHILELRGQPIKAFIKSVTRSSTSRLNIPLALAQTV